MKYIKLIAIILAALVAIPTEAKSYGGGGRSSSFGGGSSKSYSSGTNKSTSNSSKSIWGGKSTAPQSSTRVESNVSKAQYEKAVKSGKAFPSRTDAINDFKAKNASTYTSKYSVEPSTRPSHIPSTYRSGGTTYNITYDRNNGGYGYWSGGNTGIGTFMLYDAMSDAVMMNTLMSNQGYYYGAKPSTNTVGSAFLTIVLSILGVIALGAFAAMFLSK